MHATDALREADRLMAICNACRYCEGLCAVFPAMERRTSFGDGDLAYLANLCHGCGACYAACQFAPPHEFAVDVPRTLARVRADSYATHAWPAAAAGLFRRNGLAVATIAAASVAGFILGFVAWIDAGAMFAVHRGPGAFYRLMPHGSMAALFGAAFLYAVIAIAISVRDFRRATGAQAAGGGLTAFVDAVRAAATLRHLGGGGAGCATADEPPSAARRHAHHATFYGFLLCFASTSVATLYHYGFGREAPYPWYDLPVVLGVLGGLGLIVGPIGLLRAKRQAARLDRSLDLRGMDTAFIVMLLLTSVTGMLLLALRETAAMGLLLAIHLGVVFALFITLPYGKFVHGLYRFAALVQSAGETRRSSGH